MTSWGLGWVLNYKTLNIAINGTRRAASMSTSTQPAASLQAEVNRLRLQVESLQVKDGAAPIAIGDYILARLEQLKVTVSSPQSFLNQSLNVGCRKCLGSQVVSLYRHLNDSNSYLVH